MTETRLEPAQEPWAEAGDATAEMFADPAPDAAVPDATAADATAPGATASGPAASAYTVIARKYRPRTFDDLVGQEGMVRTLKNAFATGRIAHAFMLTGVRGVGKTTTARLLARALEYESDTIRAPSLEALNAEGRHCRAIIDGRCLDVLELDAASRTKVDEMRELLDGVRYAPAEARYKVYIIDEVHMLSGHAFNALLKTLEEPPPHAKFIFATTEIRKVPVTILSRCQRFDLRRVEPEVIAANLAAIAEAEGARIDGEALALISRAAEGSVRDAQSLLDQAIVQAEPGEAVSAAAVRDMLGLADRARTITLFEQIIAGQLTDALQSFTELHRLGADPARVAADLLEHCHGASIAKALRPDVLGLPKDQAARLAAAGAALSAGTLSRLWQMLLKGLDEIGAAPDPAAAMEMVIIRLVYAADLPGPEEAIDALRDSPTDTSPRTDGASRSAGRFSGGGASAALRAESAPARAIVTAPVLATFEDVTALIDARREVALKLDVERHLRLISFRPGAIVFEPTADAPADLAQRLAGKLKAWTGQTWLVAAETGGGAETLAERRRREEAEELAAVRADPFVQAVVETFPGAQIVEVRKILDALPEVAADGPDAED